MHIAILTHNYPRHPGDGRAAAGLFVPDFAHALQAHGHQVIVLTPNVVGEKVPDPSLQVRWFPWRGGDKKLGHLHPLQPGDGLALISLFYQGCQAAIQLVQEERIERCLALWAVPSGFFAWVAHLKLGCPYDVWALGSDIWTYGRHPLLRPLIRQVLQHADHRFADGLELCQEVEQLAKRPCRFLPTTRRLPVETTPPAPLDAKKFHFLYIGRWEPAKGLDVLVDAFARIAPRHPRIHLHIFGGGSLESLIRSKVERDGLAPKVTLYGYADPVTVVAYMKACDMLVIPSRIESIPILFSDAMQVGIPVIATDVGDLGDLVRRYGVGMVVAPEDPQALAEAMEKAVNGRLSVPTEALRTAASAFGVEKVAETYLAELGMATNRRERPPTADRRPPRGVRSPKSEVLSTVPVRGQGPTPNSSWTSDVEPRASDRTGRSAVGRQRSFSDLPALEGGPPVRREFLIFGQPDIREAEIEEVVDTLRSKWIGTGPKAARFEEQFREYTGAQHAVALSSCTAGLALALEVLGISAGDEVITTPITFAATANVIVHRGARPVFVDVELESMNLDPNQIEAAITPRTRAIVPVHLAGRPCRMDAIMEIAAQHGLWVIEDAAHALEAWYRDRKVGNIGHLTAFSFYATKNVTTGEGGMLTTNRQDWAERIRLLSLHGISKHAWERYAAEGFQPYDVVYPGYKCNMMDLQAAIGIHQLARVEENLKRREEIWARYDAAFADLEEVQTPAPFSEGRHARHLYTLLIRPETLRIDRLGFARALHAENIGTGIHFLPLHLTQYYRKRLGFREGDFPNAEFIGARTLSLPLSAGLSDQDVEDVIAAVHRIVRYYRR